MNILKQLPHDIEQVIKQLDENGTCPNLVPSEASSRSTVYKIDDYCLKIYTPKGRKDGEGEWNALSALQGGVAPDLYAYSSGVFVLTEWIEGLNLHQYKKAHGHFPPNLIYDFFKTELELIKAGLKDWDFKLEESIVWLDTGEVKRLDFGICEPILNSALEHMENSLKNEIQEVYNNELHNIEQKLYRSGITTTEVIQAISVFQSCTPKLV
ncbi:MULTISPECIES: hypothetical protein [Paenibacillus]|uniref:hypothetical protein n=1 Tax=Paenibacillus TaxID=44249 RepID=UPI0004036210|nr:MULTISPECIES: hypothetical protein [Paenibacillus]KGP81115.1 hypothetical protein P364_0117635 [Paenibacillus sp. MAEPY2]KGP86175.1 hypothetical protein P363_0119075 [Paenibacillus sp. MAEPY1]OZQ71024.1 hypothetical protein CA599_10825 [Paenibacillus taichungensis]